MTINGQILRDAIISGANNIYNRRREVDELNVFPVPDGDTGTNMSMTIKNAALELSNVPSGATVGEAAKKAASAMLRGARGNSGVILSLLFRGLSKGLAGKDSVSAKDLSASFKIGVDAAYKSVMKPTEGTILTVAREAYENTVDKTESTVEDFMLLYIEEAKKSLEKTPELLPVLKKAGVVDAGGMGYIVILEGMLSVISKKGIIPNEDDVKPSAPAAVAAAEQTPNFAYTAEYVIIKNSGSKSGEALLAVLETLGENVMVADEDDFIKVNIDTDHPGKAIEEGIKLGELTKIKIENNREQNELVVKADMAQQKKRRLPVEPVNETGFVAVAAGAGIEALFKDLGADNVVCGGQTMNPSTEDILEAIGQTPAKNVFVLPNNKNIIMAAEQAAELADRKVCVLQTRTIPQGITAMMNYNPDSSFAQNRAAMTEAFDRVQSGQITFAVRDSEFDGHKIKEGELLAMDNGKIVFTERNLSKALTKLVKRLISPSSSYVTVIYGSDVSDEDAEEAFENLRQRISGDIDIVLVNGGQPVYYYIISVE
ncbi:MAG: DAK2 domain-containing protein [Oscillospiraceae bacterium]|nr:DAK2 domain-containing protein [Oscillospiraceae bacterium]